MTAAPPVTLADFLLARLDEDEDLARGYGPHVTAAQLNAVIALGNDPAEHFTATRVLAEVEAKRRIIVCYHEAMNEHQIGSAKWMRVLCLLALPYADHPDYDERWRP